MLIIKSGLFMLASRAIARATSVWFRPPSRPQSPTCGTFFQVKRPWVQPLINSQPPGTRTTKNLVRSSGFVGLCASSDTARTVPSASRLSTTIALRHMGTHVTPARTLTINV